eukprot:Sdes_comp9963_c0_seq1m1519
MDAQRALLDELMGRDRNRTRNEESRDIHWSDRGVCKYFLCGFCPYELFANTKSDIGTCSKLHDDKLKIKYDQSSRKGTYGYEEDFYRFLRQIISDLDRKIRRGYERLRIEQSTLETDVTLKEVKAEKMHMIRDKIENLLVTMEDLAAEGKIEESQKILQLIETLKSEVAELEKSSDANPGAAYEKKMEVCQVCGAFLVMNDAQQRIDAHIQGKQHLGYERVRNTLDEMEKNRSERRERKGSRDNILKDRSRCGSRNRDEREASHESHKNNPSSEHHHHRNGSRKRSRSRSPSSRDRKHHSHHY